VKQTPVVGILLESCWNFCFRSERQAAARLRVCGLLFCGALICLNLLLSGCRKSGEMLPDIIVEHEIAPQPPKIGSATITLKLSDSGGTSQNGAQINLEGNMSHAGMRPVFSEARELEPGRYEAPIEFTMGGDWIILVRVTLPDGRKFQRQLDVKAVQSE
jgi:hypothetical protein